MKCKISERRLALFIRGDLDKKTVDILSGHIESCEPCRRRADALRASCEAVQALRSDAALDPEESEGMRSLVLQEIHALGAQPRPIYTPGRVVAGVFAAILLAASGGFAFMDAPSRKDTAPAAAIPREIQVAAVPASAPKDQPLVVKMLTDDPSIVVYWLSAE